MYCTHTYLKRNDRREANIEATPTKNRIDYRIRMLRWDFSLSFFFPLFFSFLVLLCVCVCRFPFQINHPLLLVGDTGTAKTANMLNYLKNLSADRNVRCFICDLSRVPLFFGSLVVGLIFVCFAHLRCVPFSLSFFYGSKVCDESIHTHTHRKRSSQRLFRIRGTIISSYPLFPKHFCFFFLNSLFILFRKCVLARLTSVTLTQKKKIQLLFFSSQNKLSSHTQHYHYM